MCGTLKHEKIASKIGNPLTIDAGGQNVQGVWNGHAREETLTNWTSKGWVEGKLRGVQSYTEGRGLKETEFAVPQGKAIKIIYHPGVTIGDNKHPFQIVTRDAVTPHEKDIHPRFPRLIDE